MTDGDLKVSFPAIEVDGETYFFINKENFEQVIITKKHAIFRAKKAQENSDKV